MIDINKMMVSNKLPCNNGKDCRYIAGYQVDGVLIPPFIKTPKNLFSYGVSQYDTNSAYAMSFYVSEEKGWESQLFEKMATEPIQREGRYVNGNWKREKNVYRKMLMLKMFHVTCIAMQRLC